MARMPRLVVPGYPHHVTQRGARRQTTFFSIEDYRKYSDLVAGACDITSVDVWAYCLMPNHVHFVVVPGNEQSLARLFKEAHRRYTRHVNLRNNWRGHLWQERFHSFVMDERYLLAAVRYVELNPVRAGLCRRPEDWPWSSARAHLSGENDALVNVRPMLERITDWDRYLSQDVDHDIVDAIRKHTRTGRPKGDDGFLSRLESATGRSLRKGKPGRQRLGKSADKGNK